MSCNGGRGFRHGAIRTGPEVATTGQIDLIGWQIFVKVVESPSDDLTVLGICIRAEPPKVLVVRKNQTKLSSSLAIAPLLYIGA